MTTQLTSPTTTRPGPLAGRVRSRQTATISRSNDWERNNLRTATDEQLAAALGWFSIGLGVIEIVAPRGLGRLIGASDYASWLPLFGLREIASGIEILRQQRPSAGLLSRVAGDVMDLAFLAVASQGRNAQPARLAATALAVAGVTALDVLCSERVNQLPLANTPRGAARSGIRLRHAITVNKPAADLYGAWRELENLPRWMRHLESVKKTGENTTHWIAKGPAGMAVAWDAETVSDQVDRCIAWRSKEGSNVDTSGSVEFVAAPGNRGTEIRIELTYDPPGGRLGAVVASLFGRSPEQEIQEDLRRFKSIMETGEAPRTHGQPHGRCAY